MHGGFAHLRTQGGKERGELLGAVECCPAELSEPPPSQGDHQRRVVLIGVNDANERAGTWDADLYLYESWPVTAGFSPQTEGRQRSLRQTEDEDFDLTTLDKYRAPAQKRIHVKLHTGYNLGGFV